MPSNPRPKKNPSNDRRPDRNDRADRSDKHVTDEGTQWRGEETNYRGLNHAPSDGKKHRDLRDIRGQNAPANVSGRPGNAPAGPVDNQHHSHDNGARDFETYLCFEQQLVKNGDNFVARPAVDAPNPRIVGKAMFHFARDLSRMYYRIFVFCSSPEGSNNPNTNITTANLCAGSASENGPIVAILAKIDGPPKEVGKNGQGIKTAGTMVNSDIQNVASSTGFTYNTVASVFEGMIGGDIYLNILGNNGASDKVAYDEGLIRGQIFHV